MKLKLSDLIALLYFAAITAFIFLAKDTFIYLTKTYPYPMGFIKVGLLATFGECLKYRLTNHKWIPYKICLRFLVWGLFGIWFAAAFPYSDGGVVALDNGGLWPGASALSKSAWINILGGYAFFMMFIHYWMDTMIAEGPCWPWKIFGTPQSVKWAKIVFIAMFVWWLPAHTFTFSQPPEWRVVIAAYLSVSLGLILAFASGFEVRKTIT